MTRTSARWQFLVCRPAWLLALMTLCFWGDSEASGQLTAQLPQFRRFQINGSIMVPDRGSAYMGGVSGSGIGSRQYGAFPGRPFSNRAIGGEFNNATVVTSVEVYSLREMEAQLMGQLSPEYREQLAKEATATDEKAEQQWAAVQAKFRELRQKHAAEKTERAKEDVRWARKFAAAGNHLAADMYYQQAIESLPPDLAVLAEKEHQSYRQTRTKQ